MLYIEVHATLSLLLPCLSICRHTDSLVRAWPHALSGAPWLPGCRKHHDVVSKPAELSGALQEKVHCCKCSATTHEHEYVQCFYVVMATGIANQEILKPGQPLGYTLREIEAQSLKSCDDENGMHILHSCNCCDSKKIVFLLSSCERSFLNSLQTCWPAYTSQSSP